MAPTAEKTRTAQKSSARNQAQEKDPKGTPTPATQEQAPKTDESGPIEAWALEHSSRGGDLWHAVKFEIKRKGFHCTAREVDRLPATLKIIATEHIRDNISRLKL